MKISSIYGYSFSSYIKKTKQILSKIAFEEKFQFFFNFLLAFTDYKKNHYEFLSLTYPK